jgi:hypothetical protein
VYDNAVRLLAAVDVAAMCRWLKLDVEGEPERLSESLPTHAQNADLVVRIGPGRLAQVEFTRRPEPWFAERMIEYRSRIMTRERGCALSQHVVVLDRGRAPRFVRDGDEFAMRLHVTYLRDHEPVEFLTDPSLAPLAVLARSTGIAGHVHALREALDVLAGVNDPRRREKLTGVASVLAAIHLDADTIERVTKESDMPISLEGTVAGRSLEARGEARGRRTVIATLLRRRFGDDDRIPTVAERLASLPQELAVSTALEAATLDELATDR